MSGTTAGQALMHSVFEHLADGQLHAGSELASQLGVSRTAIWKAVSGLRALGLAIDSVRRQGYRAPHGYTPLVAERIAAQLPVAARITLRQGTVLWSTASTNALLLAQPGPPPGHFVYCMAEYQTAGRGRRGRRWLAAPGGALCLSVSWSFGALPADAGAMSLAVGVAIWRVLCRFGVNAARLKWPNDVLLGGSKLCGVLLELRAEMAGPAVVVVGIGLNCRLGAGADAVVHDGGLAPADLADAGLARVDRNELAAALIAETVAALQTFADSGFASFAADWRAADGLTGAAVVVRGTQQETHGIAEGIDSDGALRVRTAAGLQRFTSGDVSVRSQA